MKKNRSHQGRIRIRIFKVKTKLDLVMFRAMIVKAWGRIK